MCLPCVTTIQNSCTYLTIFPILQNDIKELHTAAVHGEPDKVADREFRQQVYLSKDSNGLSAFHKTVVNGHREMAEHMMEKTDRAVFNTVDRNGRTALHYAAALSEFDDHGMYGWLLNMGADRAHADNFMKIAEHYVTHGTEIDVSKCTFIPEAPRVMNADQDGHSEAVIDTQMSNQPNQLIPPMQKTSKMRKMASANQKSSAAAAAAAVAVKSEKALYTLLPRNVSADMVNKAIKSGDVERMEQAVLMGKGKLIVGKATWNDTARNYIKSVPEEMANIDALFQAATNNQFAKMKELLAKNRKYVFARDTLGRTVLHLAAMAANIECVKHILNEDAEYTKLLDNEGRSVLHYAARCGNEEACREIYDECIMSGADKFSKDSFGNDADYYLEHEFPKSEALTKPMGKKKRSKSKSGKDGMFSKNAKPSTKEDKDLDLDLEAADDSSPVVENALENKDWDKLVKYVLDGNSERLKDRASDDEEVQEFINNIPAFQEKIESIHNAVEEGSLRTLQEIMNRKKYALAKEKDTGATILHKAIIYGHSDIINYLAANFPNTLTIKDCMGRTPVHYAAICNDGGQYYKMLQDYGGDTGDVDQMGNTPEYYSTNKTDMDFNDLIDYVQKKKLLPQDSGRSSSMSVSRHSTANAADSALTRWVLSKDTYSERTMKGGPQFTVEPETLKKLENGFRRITWARRQYSSSLLKRFLTRPVFELLKHRVTTSGVNLYDVACSGFEILDSHVGAFAMDLDSYVTFLPLLHPIICSIHGCSPEQSQPQTNWVNIGHIDLSLDVDHKFIDSIRVSVVRTLRQYPFVPKMSQEQLEFMERDIRTVLKSSPGLTGVYYSLRNLPKDVRRHLAKDGLVFDTDSKLLQCAGGYNNWPVGRGVFVTHTRDAYIWLNASEHLTVTVLQKDGNIKRAFQKLATLLVTLEADADGFKWAKDEEKFGFLTFSPANVGTGLKVHVQMKLPFMANEEMFRTELCDQYGLECVKVGFQAPNTFVVSNRRTFGVNESEIVTSVFRGLREIVDIEQRCSMDSTSSHEVEVVQLN